MITLPPGCVDEETNSPVVDVGQCIDDSCFAMHLMPHNCTDNYCCQSLTEKNVVIRCSAGMSFNVSRATSCGCGHCSPKMSMVKGIATGGPNNTPFKYGYIYSAGKYRTQAGTNGDFSFSMPSNITRVVLNFKGKDRYNDFQDLTKVVTVVPGHQTFIEVRLKPRSMPMKVNASQTIEIPMGQSNSSEGGPALTALSLPPQSLMTEDGEIYNGTANVEVSFADPRNATLIQEADGDFTAVSYDGDQQLLETFGVLKINFTDLNGKPLQARTDTDVHLDLDEYNITEGEAEDIKLWYMDEKTGRWRMMDSGLKQHESRRSKRSGRKFYLGKIDHTIYSKLINIDMIQSKTCFIKIKVGDNTVGAQSVLITVTSTQGNLYRYFDYATSTGTSSCIQTFCKNLTIQARITSNNKILIPIDNLSPILKSLFGVMYYRDENVFERFVNRIFLKDISSTEQFIDIPFFTDQEKCESSKESLLFEHPKRNKSIRVSKNPKWHKDPEKGVCFVKIAAEDSCNNKDVFFHVETTDVSKSTQSKLGFSIVSISKSDRSTCAEFKCPSPERNLRVTVTPCVQGKFTTNKNETKMFLQSHEKEDKNIKAFVNEVFDFSPRYQLNYPAIGVIYASNMADVSKNTFFHEKVRKDCEKAVTKAGISFKCD